VRPLDVLLLEDDENDAALLAERLESAGLALALTRVQTEAKFLEAIGSDRWDAILADYNIPGYDGTRALLAARERLPDTPFVFVTGAVGEERAIELLKLGATDYVLKDRPERLPTSLRRAVDEAREKAERKRAAEFEHQLVAIVSHDLRNPLNVILLASSVAKTLDRTAPELARLLDRIHASSERAARMICDILDFTQSRRGGIAITRRKIDLRDVVTRTLDELESTAKGRTITFTPRGETSGEWDADRLAQVVSNLLTNALRYSPRDTEIAIEINGRAESVVLTVHNLGTPIPAALQARLFQPMVRGDEPINRAVRSVGLGLYIAEHIVLAHGGTIGVTSESGVGTTFRVVLPRTRATT
jgi:signal transduction histidine kinase